MDPTFQSSLDIPIHGGDWAHDRILRAQHIKNMLRPAPHGLTMYIVKEQAPVVREAHDRLQSCLAQLLPPLEGDHCHQDGIALVRRSVKRGAPTAAVSASKIANEATRNFDEKTGVASLLRD
jgi:hypothetical protein